MAISEKRRHELMKRVEQVFGSDHAETMMELLPPVGWADVATKSLLRSTTDELRHDLEELGGELRSTRDELHQLRRDVITWILASTGIQTVVIGVIGVLVALR